MIVTRRYFGEFNGDQIIIDTAAGGAEIAHELGHNAGIADISEPNPPDPWTASLLMYNDATHWIPNTQYCRESDAEAFQYHDWD